VRQLRFDAIIFDKDGTLLDIDRTWSPAIAAAIDAITPHKRTRRTLAEVMGFDLDRRRVLPNAPIMTLSNEQLADLAEPLVDGWAFIDSVTEQVLHTVTPMKDAASTLTSLRNLGLPLAIVTNDEEASTTEQLASLGWTEQFDLVYGYDSGHGCKPDPAVLLAAAQDLGVEPARTMMVGDSATDLLAARAANMSAVLISDDETNAHLADVHIQRLSELVDMA